MGDRDLPSGPPPRRPWFAPAADGAVTAVAWLYYTLGYLLVFGPCHLAALLFASDRERAFQKINHLFYKYFFRLIRKITPGITFEIDEAVRGLRSAVIVCNHISYLDPILLISLYPRQKTIVKSRFFRLPLFGWVLRASGYIPSDPAGDLQLVAVREIEGMDGFLAEGGNLFVFPEGTRRRDGIIGPFSKGAFKIARRCRAPVAVVAIRNTDRLYRPGRFRFITCRPTTISLALAGVIRTDGTAERMPVSVLMDRTRALLEGRQAGGTETISNTLHEGL
jgi:1-acyl-sn-glycerol-3-phosphate acyltransferase